MSWTCVSGICCVDARVEISNLQTSNYAGKRNRLAHVQVWHFGATEKTIYADETPFVMSCCKTKHHAFTHSYAELTRIIRRLI